MGFSGHSLIVFRNNRNLLVDRRKLFTTPQPTEDQKKLDSLLTQDERWTTSVYKKEQVKKNRKAHFYRIQKDNLIKNLLAIALLAICIVILIYITS